MEPKNKEGKRKGERKTESNAKSQRRGNQELDADIISSSKNTLNISKSKFEHDIGSKIVPSSLWPTADQSIPSRSPNTGRTQEASFRFSGTPSSLQHNLQGSSSKSESALPTDSPLMNNSSNAPVTSQIISSHIRSANQQNSNDPPQICPWNCGLCAATYVRPFDQMPKGWKHRLVVVFDLLERHNFRKWQHPTTDIFPFIEFHWQSFSSEGFKKVAKKRNWKVTLQDALAHNKEMFESGQPIMHKKGHWRYIHPNETEDDRRALFLSLVKLSELVEEASEPVADITPPAIAPTTPPVSDSPSNSATSQALSVATPPSNLPYPEPSTQQTPFIPAVSATSAAENLLSDEITEGSKPPPEFTGLPAQTDSALSRDFANYLSRNNHIYRQQFPGNK
eukprot:TRINITY_DN11814_c0_g1_i1.p1 TRINITY_DN11814_c0_g1~~TRINITY_DN11814_c0_g1_i1.p1  ORF type:complete len:432 (+),score=49.79 TRINITY_DN11814_c0_g1_i1:116-1297(+)